ncbi:RNA 2',3'-cyclic phosphodiesterase [Kitasatospora sp. NPDC049285]|uniref:RNA 2',3'-cyclic phosphodiesterase n=1 Tax=Kitasatospora sp. NPDC049285 TaxID=3157096 RepID=UPI00341C0546
MRLFVAVNPPVPALQELADAAAPLRSMPGADRLHWSEPAGWHLTLAFLGEVPASDVPRLETGLARVAGECGAHRLRLAGGGTFGDRVLWSGVDGEVWALRRLAEQVREALDVTDDTHGFHPHLTLARAGSTRGRRRAEQRAAVGELHAMAAVMDGFRGTEWQAGRLELMRSELGYGPARYTTVGEWPLADWGARP